MKDKILSYIEKIKPWIKTKKAWVQIGLSLVAIVCLVAAGVSSCSRNNVIEDNIEHTEEATEKPSEQPTDEPVVTATPIATEVPVTATPVVKETEETDNSSNSNELILTTPGRTISSNSYDGPTGAPLYTQVPEENVDTRADAYRTLVQSCSASVDYSGYYLYDMDADGVDEIILHYGSDDLAAYVDIYTYTEDGLMFVGDSTGSFASFSGSTEPGLIVYYRREINGQKYESIERLVKTGTSMYVNTVVVQDQVTEYTVLEDDVAITRYKLNDLSPIS